MAGPVIDPLRPPQDSGAAAAAASAEAADRVAWRTVLGFGAPGLGAGYMYLMLALYVMKFSTDVLLIAPAVMGLIFSVSRIWDAVSDPLVGYLSDRTRIAYGRRRSWILASTIPIGAAFIMVFAPPASLTGGALVAWMAVAIIGFYSAMTVFFVPHLSLGAELSRSYHERSRLFGVRHGFYTFGSILSLVSFYVLISAEQEGPEAVRAIARDLAVLVAVAMALLIFFALGQIKERPEYRGRVNANPFFAFRDICRNPHARLLIVVTFIEHVGSAAIGALTLYVAQYVVGAPLWAPVMILCYMLPSSLSVPLWIPLSRRFGKVRLWMFSMILTGVSFGCMFALPWLEGTTLKIGYICVAAAFAGFAAGCGGTLSPSIQGDVIDYDELQTGERKEGSYFAAWNFVYKGATGVMLLLTGFVLQFSGFVPNQVQPINVQLAMVTLYGLFPLVCYGVGAFMFRKFSLDETAHAEIRRQLDERRGV
ncbi:MAG: MFS transporter [Pseudomonadales bacterium]|nr:MFS transporter [Pseudomonadales bacterium]